MKRKTYLVAIVMLCLLGLFTGCSLPGAADPCAGRPTRQVDVSPQAAQSLSDKANAATAPDGTFRLEITEQEATSYLALQISGAPVSQAVIWFTPGKAYLQGQVDIAGQHQIQAALNLAVSEGTLTLALPCAKLDGIAMPGAALSGLQTQLNAQLNQYSASIRVDEVQIKDGSLLVVGKSQ